jgi:hypothetical protein
MIGTGYLSPMACLTGCRLLPSRQSGSLPVYLTVRESMVLLEGRGFTGDPPGLLTVQCGPLMLVYLTDVRGERVVVIQVNWIGWGTALRAGRSGWRRGQTAVPWPTSRIDIPAVCIWCGRD